jgi:hypothetical protein
MNFEKDIQQWVSIDNQLKILNEKVKELRDKKNELSTNLTKYAETNDLSNKIIQITDGKLKFVKTRVAAPLTYKYLEKSLSDIIKNDTQVKQIIHYLKENRESKIVQELKRY